MNEFLLLERINTPFIFKRTNSFLYELRVKHYTLVPIVFLLSRNFIPVSIQFLVINKNLLIPVLNNFN